MAHWSGRDEWWLMETNYNIIRKNLDWLALAAARACAEIWVPSVFCAWPTQPSFGSAALVTSFSRCGWSCTLCFLMRLFFTIGSIANPPPEVDYQHNPEADWGIKWTGSWPGSSWLRFLLNPRRSFRVSWTKSTHAFWRISSPTPEERCPLHRFSARHCNPPSETALPHGFGCWSA